MASWVLIFDDLCQRLGAMFFSLRRQTYFMEKNVNIGIIRSSDNLLLS